jgi:hypothetical protein
MQLSQAIARIRAANTMFGDRVAGAAEAAVALDKGALALPAAYVVPQADGAGAPSRTDSSRRQLVTETIGVLAVLDNRTPAAGGVSDERGQAASDQAQLARRDLWRALLTWCASPEQGYEPLYYTGSELRLIDDARLAVLFRFACDYAIDATDGLPSDAPEFDGLDVKVDVIDPAADPNIAYPGPDGRIEVDAPVTLND